MSFDAFGLIYTGDANPRLRDLTVSRAVGALPFGGRYRVIDFVLSDLVNSGVNSVGLITQKNYHSLMDHVGSGKEWDLHRKREGLFLLPPFLTKDSEGIYRGSADAIRACLGYVRRCKQKYVILSGSHIIFNTTFNEMLERHIETKADITLMYNEETDFHPEDQNSDLRLYLADDGRVTGMELDPYRPGSPYRGLDVFIMEKNLLEYLVEDAYAHGEYAFIRDILLKKCDSLRIFGWRYDGYAARIDSVGSYYRANMDMLDPAVRAELYDRKHPIYTKVKDEISASYGPEAAVTGSILADGCSIRGTVSDSVLFRGVHVGEGTTVRNSIIMQGVIIEDGCTLDNVIIDKGATIRKGRTLIGYESFPIILKKNITV